MSATVDLIILGMAAKAPCSAYDIQKGVEYRNLSNWVRFSTPAIYKKVLRLEQQGYLESTPIRAGKMPEKAIYSLTAAGTEYFHDQMRKTARQQVELLFDFNAVIANLNKLDTEEAAGLISDIRKGIERSRGFLAEMIPQRAHIPLVGRAVLDQQLAVSEALSAWAERFEQDFNSGQT